MYGSPPKICLYIPTFGDTWRTQHITSVISTPSGKGRNYCQCVVKIHKDASIMRTLTAQSGSAVRDGRLGPGHRALLKADGDSLRGGSWKDGSQGSNPEARTANKHFSFWSPAYTSKETPGLTCFLRCGCLYTPKRDFFHLWPKIDQRRIIIAGVCQGECLNQKTGCLIQLCPRGYRYHNSNNDNDSVSYHLLSTYYMLST